MKSYSPSKAIYVDTALADTQAALKLNSACCHMRRVPAGVFLPPSPWAWIDPGAFALIGAGAFMGGVTRLTVALAVIMMEVKPGHSS